MPRMPVRSAATAMAAVATLGLSTAAFAAEIAGRMACDYTDQQVLPAQTPPGHAVLFATARCVVESGPGSGATGQVSSLVEVDASGNGHYLSSFGYTRDARGYASWQLVEAAMTTRLVDGKPVPTSRGKSKTIAAAGQSADQLDRISEWTVTPTGERSFRIDYLTR